MPFLVMSRKGGYGGCNSPRLAYACPSMVPAAWPGMCLRWGSPPPPCQCTAIDRTVLLAPWGGAKAPGVSRAMCRSPRARAARWQLRWLLPRGARASTQPDRDPEPARRVHPGRAPGPGVPTGLAASKLKAASLPVGPAPSLPDSGPLETDSRSGRRRAAVVALSIDRASNWSAGICGQNQRHRDRSERTMNRPPKLESGELHADDSILMYSGPGSRPLASGY